MKTLAALFCWLLIGTVIAQPSRFEYKLFVSGKDSLRYRLLYPDNDTNQRYPMVVFLHGSGERGSDNDGQLKWGVINYASDESMKMHPCFVIAPQCPEGERWADFEDTDKWGDATKSMVLLRELIDWMVKTFNIDTGRIYITGLSMGGYGVYDAIMRYPHLFAAAVPVCGGGDSSKASLIKDLPIWIIHSADDPVVSPDYSLKMLTALEKAGAHPGFTLYPQTGHYVWLQAFSDPLIKEWMFRQHK